MGRSIRLALILTSTTVLASSAGCQLVGIPSYRSDQGSNQCESDCPPGLLPPTPGWLARLHHKEKLPQPPQHPRFQPLPTRPMFSQDPRRPEGLGRLPNTMVQGAGSVYGRFPNAQNGGIAAANQFEDESFENMPVNGIPTNSIQTIQGSGSR